MQRVELLAVPGLPMVKAGDDLARLIGERLTGELALRPGDVVVLAQKVVRAPESDVRPTASICGASPKQRRAPVEASAHNADVSRRNRHLNRATNLEIVHADE